MYVEAIDFRRLSFIFPPQGDVTEVRFGRQVKYFWKQTTVDQRVRDQQRPSDHDLDVAHRIQWDSDLRKATLAMPSNN
jgi:hypothetical protein